MVVAGNATTKWGSCAFIQKVLCAHTLPSPLYNLSQEGAKSQGPRALKVNHAGYFACSLQRIPVDKCLCTMGWMDGPKLNVFAP